MTRAERTAHVMPAWSPRRWRYRQARHMPSMMIHQGHHARRDDSFVHSSSFAHHHHARDRHRPVSILGLKPCWGGRSAWPRHHRPRQAHSTRSSSGSEAAVANCRRARPIAARSWHRRAQGRPRPRPRALFVEPPPACKSAAPPARARPFLPGQGGRFAARSALDGRTSPQPAKAARAAWCMRRALPRCRRRAEAAIAGCGRAVASATGSSISPCSRLRSRPGSKGSSQPAVEPDADRLAFRREHAAPVRAAATPCAKLRAGGAQGVRPCRRFERLPSTSFKVAASNWTSRISPARNICSRARSSMEQHEEARFDDVTGEPLNDAARELLRRGQEEHAPLERRTDGAGQALIDSIPVVDIADGTWKYVQINIVAPDGANKLIVRNTAGLAYHANMYEAAMRQLEPLGIRGRVVGGGRIENNRAAKFVNVYGYSMTYGRTEGCNETTAELIRQSLPDDYDVVWSDDGY
eukprot:scaffold18_cov401-Prasinococcus_capsulatus_cf.AAC.13